MLPAEGQCPSTITEYFAKDTVPTKTCEVHQTITICNESHVKATEYCPDTTTYHYSTNDDGEIVLEDADFTPEKDFMDTTCPIHTKEAHEEEERIKQEEEELSNRDITYTISTIVEGGGSISGPTSAKQGESVTLTFIPNDGYTISNVTIDSVAKGAISSYTFNNIAENHSVTVTFVSSGSGDAPPDSNVYEEQVYQEYDNKYGASILPARSLLYQSFRHLWLKD
jgi:penicillin-binding protein 1A